MSIQRYWPITENEVYVRVFDEILSELDLSFFDSDLVMSYQSLTPEARYLVTRMYIRAPKWIRFEDFTKYMAPESLKISVLPTLVERGWLLSSPPLPSLITDVATLTELQELAKSLGLKTTNKSRAKIAEQLIQLEKQQSFFNSGRVSTRIADSLRIECYLLANERRKFFFQLEQNFMYPVGPEATIETIFLTHMKKQTFLSYEYYTQKERPLFDGASDFRAYEEAREVSIEIEEAVNGNDKLFQQKCVDMDKLTRIESAFHIAVEKSHAKAAYTLGRAIYNVSQIFMKLHQFQNEYSWIQKYLDQQTHRSKRGVSLIRKLLLEIRFLADSGTKGESSWLLSAINTFYDAKNEVNEIESLDLERKMPKLLSSIRSTGLQSALSFIKPAKNPVREDRPRIPVFEIIAIPAKQGDISTGTRVVYENDLNVEELALEKYATTECGEYTGGHFEGSIISTIFWLVSYDLLFQDRDQFRCAYQSTPMNLQKAIEVNKKTIEDRFTNTQHFLLHNRRKLIKLGDPRPYIGSISWYIPEEALLGVVKGLGSLLHPIISRLMSNYRRYASGFPDLTLWNSHTNRTKFVEVKSENDTVSDNQQVWMEFLVNIGVDVEICKVIPAKRVAKRKRTST